MVLRATYDTVPDTVPTISATEARARLQVMQFNLQLLEMRLDSQDVKPAIITGVLMELESLRTQFFQIVGSLAEHKDPLSKENVFATIKRISDARDRARILAPLPGSPSSIHVGIRINTDF